MIKRITLTDEHIKLIKNIKFEAFDFEDMPNKKHIGWGIDQYSLFGGTFAMEDISRILGIWDRHIPGTEESYLGADFPEDVKNHMWQLYDDIVDNMEYIISLLLTFGVDGGLTPGTYKCHSEALDWVREVEFNPNYGTEEYYKKLRAPYEQLKGDTITAIEGLEKGSSSVTFHCKSGHVYKWHPKEEGACKVDNIVGNISDIIGKEITEVLATRKMTLGKSKKPKTIDAYCFYGFAVGKNQVVITWNGKKCKHNTIELLNLCQL